MRDFDVRRILVDPSSSTDLLRASLINQIGRELFGLENPERILSGFNRATTTSLGDIMLPVQVGPVTLNVQFSVVQDLSPFNAILGRTWLHYMKTIPSTYHQMAHSDMTGIHPSVASHRLNIFPSSRPVRQKFPSATDRSKQWTIRSNKQNPDDCLREEARASQREVGRRTTGVLWAYRTTLGRPTGNTPFVLAYGMDAAYLLSELRQDDRVMQVWNSEGIWPGRMRRERAHPFRWPTTNKG
ncbi:hypothetical protein CK203_021200 [Vitis vinifera]|uniref:Uncharacterized protein n=1 Tax=Vitis vinifera TaxID=29760 RepID=A0A438IMA7_VITVI|nr:hypothetical protein CK203_021200 [Vitis vinifera]